MLQMKQKAIHFLFPLFDQKFDVSVKVSLNAKVVSFIDYYSFGMRCSCRQHDLRNKSSRKKKIINYKFFIKKKYLTHLQKLFNFTYKIQNQEFKKLLETFKKN